eukprot:TRINITY_DN2356_c0_g1_i1.p1 TRINITY_DN2356_c0_g1~~TRINITY_DN2356_c0_g1_i1.p1  ORF type:complete len:319 (+),score=99.59 TRINITY_DN2356_c0_g1_i1:64-1020(+)
MPSVILASAGYDHTIRFWEAPSGACYRTIQLSPDSQINQLKITPDKQYLAAAGNPHVRLFEANTNNPNPVTSFEGHTTNVTSLGFQKEGRWMYTGSEDGTIKIWDLRAPGSQREFDCGSPVNTVSLHPNQCEIVCGQQNGSILTYDLGKNECKPDIFNNPSGEVAIRSCNFSNNGKYFVASNNKGKAFVYESKTKSTDDFELLQTIDAHKNYLLKALFSPNSKLLATSSADKTVKIWSFDNSNSSNNNNNESPQLVHYKTLTGHVKWVWDCVFSSDSAYLVTASSDQSARLWDIGQGDSIRHYTGHHKATTCVALSDT